MKGRGNGEEERIGVRQKWMEGGVGSGTERGRIDRRKEKSKR